MDSDKVFEKENFRIYVRDERPFLLEEDGRSFHSTNSSVRKTSERNPSERNTERSSDHSSNEKNKRERRRREERGEEEEEEEEEGWEGVVIPGSFFGFLGLYGQDISLFLGFCLFFPFLFLEIGDGTEEEKRATAKTAGVIILMGFYWVTEALPLPITSMIPLFLFPFLQIMESSEVGPLYFNDTVVLLITTNMVGLAMEKFRLHERIALKVLLVLGGRPRLIILGVMFVTAALSMFMSNTATTTVMAPLVISFFQSMTGGKDAQKRGNGSMSEMSEVSGKDEEEQEFLLHDQPSSSDDFTKHLNEKEKSFGVAALLSVAYSASVGGAATLVGTGTNLAFKALVDGLYPNSPGVSFGTWMAFALPFVIICLIVIWLWLILVFVRSPEGIKIDPTALKIRYQKLGPMKPEEIIIVVDLLIMIVLWITRSGFSTDSSGWGDFIEVQETSCSCTAGCDQKKTPAVDDGAVAMGAALLLFIMPTFKKNRETNRYHPVFGTRMMDWRDCKGISWGVCMLLGAGIALATASTTTGLSSALGNLIFDLGNLPIFVFIFTACLFVSFLTEFMSNVAMANLMLPIVAELADVHCENPLLFMIPVTLACSFAFMMPAATPPNAIVYSFNLIRVSDMVKAGFFLDVICVCLLSVWSYFLLPPFWGITYGEPPDWANSAAECLESTT